MLRTKPVRFRIDHLCCYGRAGAEKLYSDPLTVPIAAEIRIRDDDIAARRHGDDRIGILFDETPDACVDEAHAMPKVIESRQAHIPKVARPWWTSGSSPTCGSRQNPS